MTDELNHHNDPTWLMHSVRAASGTNPYLGDIGEVDAIVRRFVAGVIERFEDVSNGISTPDAASEADKQACLTIGAIFTGQAPHYTPVKGWTDGGLANYVRQRMEESAHPNESDAEVVAQAAASLVHSVYAMVIEMADAAEPSQEQIAKMNDHIRSLVWLLAGIESNE
jgi:transposase